MSIVPSSIQTVVTSDAAQPVIVAEHLYKRYQLRAYIPSLRHELANMVKSAVKRVSGSSRGQPFWALQDVTFSVYSGESVAIVGRNGAGKSTLFRLLCGVTSPTSGNIEVRGRFATLIALGS